MEPSTSSVLVAIAIVAVVAAAVDSGAKREVISYCAFRCPRQQTLPHERGVTDQTYNKFNKKTTNKNGYSGTSNGINDSTVRD